MNINALTLADLASPIANAIVGGPFGSNLVSKDYVSNGVPVIRGQNMGSKWVTGEFVFVSSGKAAQLAANKARPGDLVFTQRGTLGQVSIVPDGQWAEYIVSQSQMKITPDPHRVDVNFLYYLFRTEAQQRYILDSAIQAGVPHTNLGILKKTPIKLPSLSVQRRIAQVLSAFDDRIALLRETNATLEAIAQALFKSWFVDFDPVRAKAEGREPEGLSAEIAGLFPDTLVQTQVGLIPKGWEIKALQDLLVLQRGFDLPSGQRIPGDYPIIAASGPSGTHVMGMAKGPGVITGRSGVIGRVYLELDDYWPLNTSLWVKEFRAATPCYAYELLKRMDLGSFNAGSAVPTLNRNHVHNLPCVVPPVGPVSAYEAIALSLHKRARENTKHAETLATIRDALLPRLISGQLRLPEAEALLQDAA